MKNRIAILICWYGPFPWYFSYFLHSCSYNPTIDFYIITDNNEVIQSKPKNITFVNRTLEEVVQSASKKFGFTITVGYPYKLCDFKPAYGFMFSEIVENYDFWGHGDIDVIFGRIRNFITDEILNEYDLISVRPDWITGCFLLFRNNQKMNTLFKKSKDYKKVFSTNRLYCFDETAFAHDEFSEGKKYFDIKTEIESMMHVVQKMEEKKHIKYYSDLHIIDGVPGKMKWENGILTFRNKYEILLYHLIIFKKVSKSKTKIKAIPTAFTISSSRIYHKQLM
jgi:hypothetical protein